MNTLAAYFFIQTIIVHYYYKVNNEDADQTIGQSDQNFQCSIYPKNHLEAIYPLLKFNPIS